MDDIFVNYELVDKGLAKVYRYPPDTEYCDLFEEAEESAKASGKGILAQEDNSLDSTSDSLYICSYNAYNCGDFSSHAEAQKVFEACGGTNNDIHQLDGDADGIACETLS